MGVSTDAILAFGFDLGEDLPESWQGEDFDFEVLQAAEMGVEAPSEEYGEDTKGAYHAYWDRQREAVKSHPAELIRHCSDDYTMYFLAANGTRQKAHRGYPQGIDPATLAIPPERVEALRAFCDRHGIEWRESGWFLFSYWG